MVIKAIIIARLSQLFTFDITIAKQHEACLFSEFTMLYYLSICVSA